MTVATTDGSGGSVVPYDPDEFGEDTGLEDIGAGDVMIPRLRIEHAEGTFKDSLSGTSFPKLQVVLLGLVKQRIMWADEVEDKDKPLCKSPDFDHGFPNMDQDVKADKRFPWDQSNFDPSQAVPIELAPSKQHPQGWSSNGLPQLPCTSCVFQKWDQPGWKQPPCSEQHTFPLLYTPDEGDSWTPALLTLQKTGIKPSRTYISSFAASKTPMFTVFTELSLDVLTRGTVKYSVPKFKRLGATDREDWREYGDRQRQIRSFIRSAPRNTDEEEGTVVVPGPSSNVNTAPPAAATPAPAAPPAAPPPAAAPATPPPAAPAVAPPAPPEPEPAVAAAPADPVFSADDDDDEPPF